MKSVLVKSRAFFAGSNMEFIRDEIGLAHRESKARHHRF